MKPLKAIKSFFSGLLATVSPKNFADCGVKVKRPTGKFLSCTPHCAYCQKVFAWSKGGMEGILPETTALVMEHVSHCPANPLVQKLDAAAEALRRIECLTHETANLRDLEVVSHKDEIMLSVATHKIAQEAWRATQEN